MKRPAVIHLNTDWGRTSRDILVKSMKEDGLKSPPSRLPARREGLPADLGAVRDSNPDGIALIAYYSDARADRPAGAPARAEADDGRRELGVFAEADRVGRRRGRGHVHPVRLQPGGPAPGGPNFVDEFKAKYGKEPDSFNVGAYDTMILAHQLIGEFGTDRKAIRDGLAKIGRSRAWCTAGSRSTRPPAASADPRFVRLVVQGGKFVVWDGQHGA